MRDPDSVQTKALYNGFSTLSDQELLMLVLAGTPNSAILAQTLLDRFESLSLLADAPVDNFTLIPGVGRSLALRLKAALTLGQRLAVAKTIERPVIRRPSDVIALVQYEFNELPQEHLQVVLLDAHNKVLDIETVYIGSLNMTVVRIAELFRSAIKRNAAGIILVHNHPSGNTIPSPEDISLTQDTIAAGKLLDIAVLDHLILGSGDWISLREQGLGFQGEARTPGADAD